MRPTVVYSPNEDNRFAIICSLFAYIILDQLECRFVIGEDGILPSVVNSVVIFVCIAVLVHEEHTWHISLGKRIVVAVVGEFLSIQFFEIPLLCIYLLK